MSASGRQENLTEQAFVEVADWWREVKVAYWLWSKADVRA
jgi:hypothetical protein